MDLNGNLHLTDSDVKSHYKKSKLPQLAVSQGLYGGNFTKRYDDMVADHSLITASNLKILTMLDLMYNTETIVKTHGVIFKDSGMTEKRFSMHSMQGIIEFCNESGVMVSPSLRTLFMYQYAINEELVSEDLIPKDITYLLQQDEIKDALSKMNIRPDFNPLVKM